MPADHLQRNGHADPTNQAPPAPEPPLLLRAAEAAHLCGMGSATWWRHHSLARIPAPLRVGGATLWRRADLMRWIELGCPERREYEARKGS